MKSYALIAAAGVLAYAAYRYSTDTTEQDTSTDTGGEFDMGGITEGAGEILADTGQSAATFFDNITGGYMKVSAMSNVPRSALDNANVKAFLRVIRSGEGTADQGGYNRLFGGGTFSSFADHPRQIIKKSGYTSSAAGAYQFITSSWDETKRVMGLVDFSPTSQDFAAIGRIAARGALDDVIAGRFDTALGKVAREWASMPGSPYGQPVISLQTARSVYASNGGSTPYA
jgi:muramidase (phage lysozyme)